MVYHENRKVIQLFWDDLSASAKEELLEELGENGNYDVFPLAELEIEEEETNADSAHLHPDHHR